MKANRAVYDYELAEGSTGLREVLRLININGYELISVSQVGLLYTVVFQRPVNG